MAHGQSKSKGPARRPMNFEDESKGGLIGGLIASEMGPGPIPGFMDKEEIGQRAEDMQIDQLEGVKLRISEINDIASVKVSLVPTSENAITLF